MFNHFLLSVDDYGDILIIATNETLTYIKKKVMYI